MTFRARRFDSRKRGFPTVRWAKTVIAIILLPLCLGVGQAIIHIVRASGNADTFWVAMGAGAACWLVTYLSLPKPMWIYVFGHELTHALWAWFFGGRVKRFKATSKGGHVIVTKKNFAIALAPYFFPIYAIAVVVVFLAGNWILGWRRYIVFFHLLLGIAYSFHVTLTWHILRSRQSDISEQGYLFSAVIIWLGNAGVLVLGIPLLTGRVGLLTAVSWCLSETGAVFHNMAVIL